MATGAQVWSTSAASNNSIDSAVNWAEGMAPSAVNDSARAQMASAAMHIGDNSGVLASSGSTSAYTVTSKQGSTAVVDGYTIALRLHATNASAPTLNVDGVGAKAIHGYAGTAVTSGELPGGGVQRFTYNSGSTCWIVNGYTPAPNTTLVSSLEITSALLVGGAATLSSSLTIAKAALFSTGITVTAPITLTGGAVAFPAAQTASTDVNTLDDYEEGTFTPSLSIGGSTAGISYDTRTGNYIKIGRLVYIAVQLNTAAGTGSDVIVTGLPFTSDATFGASAFSATNTNGLASYGATLAAGGSSIRGQNITVATDQTYTFAGQYIASA